MSTSSLNGALFADMVRAGAANLYSVKNRINDLNVFPIPDGDTGDNMYMTIESGASAISELPESALYSVSSHAARGMLLGARGNSGVILSRIFAGIAEGFADVQSADISTVGRAFEQGVKQAYNAVSVPVEGTILTVYKEAVQYANRQIKDTSTLESFFADFLCELRRSLERTPELLQVLKEAGVVDSGGAGFVYIAEGMKKALEGEISNFNNGGAEKQKQLDFSLFTEDSKLEFGYCTEFLLRLQNYKTDLEKFNINELIKYLNSVGESVVAFRDGSIVKVHVHTYKPGDILNYCQQYGEFLTVKIENMTLQHDSTSQTVEIKMPKAHKKYGIAAVASGNGIKETFISLGVDEIIDGGQSMNPSSADFIKAFEKISADTVFVFPGNGNVVLTARQAAEMYKDSEIVVVPTKTIGESYAALSMFDIAPDNTEEIYENTVISFEGVVTGLISRASRDAEMNGVKVKSGEYIGYTSNTIYTSSQDSITAATELTEKLSAGKYDVMLIICGKEAPAENAQKLYGIMKDKYKNTEIIMIDGGQPVYDYIITLE